MTPLRIGVLGAARITPAALFRPARTVTGVEVAAIAARDPARAAKAAKSWGVPTVHSDYAAVVNDASIEALYDSMVKSTVELKSLISVPLFSATTLLIALSTF